MGRKKHYQTMKWVSFNQHLREEIQYYTRLYLEEGRTITVLPPSPEFNFFSELLNPYDDNL
ncbi:MAG: hypothetical protein HQM11_07900 [SAR324 cluster bacterium]|nr:hypothetical protein [SAR324 cluster bacterium]